MRKIFSVSFFMIMLSFFAYSQEETSKITDQTFHGLKMRNVGPAFTSGRIADIAIHPEDENVWYIAVGSGGVWKTTNAGTTFEPIFDSQPSYSIGCVTIDPTNTDVIWVGTGENVGGRHVGFGDGIYRSPDGGRSWKNMGLKASEHISKIIVHPDKSEIVWVAVQGPLWNKGGERGLYKTTDGGNTWTKYLGDDEWVGVTDMVIDHSNPEILYAATWQRHRNVAAYMANGPGSGIHKSTDGGEKWTKLSGGLPRSNMGKIGLAISPMNPDVLYAAIELDRTQGGVFRSDNAGASWEKRSNTVAGGTGPHYYQELYASPHAFDRIYLADVRMKVSDDGGKTFRSMSESNKHSDNHSLAFKNSDPNYLLVGTDGGIYESYDLEKTWRFFPNLPVTQYYKVAVDDRVPFYHIFGGTQDNGSHGGPSRTDTRNGIRNRNWYKTLGGDGHQSATEPGNPDIGYAESQQGSLYRLDRITGESLSIRPRQGEGEEPERYNWDAPILVSPHAPNRIYFASQRVWRSDNRGDSWEAVSDDLTRNEDRMLLPIMDKTHSWEAGWDFKAMSEYNSITSLAESPILEGLLYAGTDDGIIQVSENGGDSWRKVMVGELPGVPETAFVNDIRADLFDANTVYVCLDNHKFGDFTPYMFKSQDRGVSWTNIGKGLPDNHLVWRMVQDHIRSDLLFAATEFGIFFTMDGGEKWVKLKGGVPTISFRDITIQRRENDLVGASFGRGFFILDDISPLRQISEEVLAAEATLFPPENAWWYVRRDLIGDTGANEYVAEDHPYGAVFTYYLSEGYKTLKSERLTRDKNLLKDGDDITFPGWEVLEAERRQPVPKVWLTIKDTEGRVVQQVEGKSSAGFHRATWNMYLKSARSVGVSSSSSSSYHSTGLIAPPGTYTVTLSKEMDGMITQLSDPMPFDLVPLYEGALERATPQELASFQAEYNQIYEEITATSIALTAAKKKVEVLGKVVHNLDVASPELVREVYEAKQRLLNLDEVVNSHKSKEEIGVQTKLSPTSRLYAAATGLSTTYGPTEANRQQLSIAIREHRVIRTELHDIVTNIIPAIEERMMSKGAPWIEGQPLPKE